MENPPSPHRYDHHWHHQGRHLLHLHPLCPHPPHPLSRSKWTYTRCSKIPPQRPPHSLHQIPPRHLFDPRTSHRSSSISSHPNTSKGNPQPHPRNLHNWV